MTTDDAEGQARMGAFLQGLQHLGWVDGRNVRIEARWTFGREFIPQHWRPHARLREAPHVAAGQVALPLRDYLEVSHSHERHTVHGLHEHKSHE